MRRAPGFTLLEIMIVLAIAGILIALTVPMLSNYFERARYVQAITDMKDMQKTIKQFEFSSGALPDSLATVSLDTKLDPWNRPYQYFNLRTAKGNGQARKDKKLAPLNSDFDLYSVGPDGLTAAQLNNSKSRDDIVRARDGGFLGTAEEFDP
jgi:general secretion pathway protein G